MKEFRVTVQLDRKWNEEDATALDVLLQKRFTVVNNGFQQSALAGDVGKCGKWLQEREAIIDLVKAIEPELPW